MLDIQTKSYADFLQMDIAKSKRKEQGLQTVLKEVFPIETVDGSYKLDFVSYSLEKPKYSILDCQKRGLSYASGLRVRLRLKSKKETKEQDVYICDLPLMTDTGTFVVNGDERVVVSQLHRSPGVSFGEIIHPSGRRLYSARIIPYRGAWIEFEFDITDTLSVFIDRRRKVLATTFLRALGFSSDEDIIKAFCGIEELNVTRESQYEKLVSRLTLEEIVDPQTNVVLAEKFTKINEATAQKLISRGIKNIRLIQQPVPEILNTLRKDHSKNQTDALIDIYRRIRPGDPPTLESANVLFNRLFFDPKRYDLGLVGRFILNRRLGMDVPENTKVLTPETVVKTIQMLLKLKNGEGNVDDIDHLGNRRIKTVGELLENQFRIGLARLERSIRERITIYDLENIMPHNLINSKLVSSVIKDFFGRSQLSQFMDQTNPLAELTHKRRLSALGPGGLSRERAGFEVRDVHHSHYGRICPIETPEGPNIGLIASLCTYARINRYGFIETPYRKVDLGKVTSKIEYLSADIEDKYIVAQANAALDSDGKLAEDAVLCRFKGDFPRADRKKVDYMDVSPRQLVSVAASLIPFLEHDDANRALMGSNMQRQAVPLLAPEAPLVGTGMEYRTAKDSGAVVVAKSDGVVKSVQADEIIIGPAIYKLRKFMRSNADTCVNQRPLVKVGQKVKAGDIIADGAGTRDGELALGSNVLAAFMPWRGYNFEDAVLVSERIVKEDLFTSVHVEKFEIEARDTRLGNEEITRDIPNIGEDALRDLDENGIVRIGAEVHPGDILVGKITPKSETELSPEEKLLRAIFGEKAGDVRDASLTVPPGVEGIIVDVKIFSRKGSTQESREEIKKEHEQVARLRKKYQQLIDQIKLEKRQKLSKLLVGAKLAEGLSDEDSGKVLIA
jgi:DNA-directed RNA polymerase subunit beta